MSIGHHAAFATTTLVNASTHVLRFALHSPLGHVAYEVEPLKAVEVLAAWTRPNEDANGRPVLPSTIAQYAPHLKPEGHPDLARARQALTNADLAAKGKPPPAGAAHAYLHWPPDEADLAAEVAARAAAQAAIVVAAHAQAQAAK